MYKKRPSRRHLLVTSGLIAITAIALTGCWTIYPERYVVFHQPIEISRETLSQATTVKMEIQNDTGGRDELVASVPLSDGALALYYVPRHDVDRVDLTPNDLSRVIVIDPTGEPVGMLNDDAVDSFPVIRGFRETDSGYDEPEDDTPVRYTDGSLRWRFAFSVIDSARSEAPPVSVDFSVSGSDEDDTRSIFVSIQGENESGRSQTIRFSLPRTVFGMKERLDAEVQRLIRSVHHRGDLVFVFDRVVDLSNRSVRQIVTEVPGSFVDHISIADDGSVAAIIYGTRRITKDAIVVPLRD